MSDTCTPFTIPVSDDNRGVSGKDASFLGDINNASDRANQDRYLASEFRSLQVATAERAASAQKDRTDDARWDSVQRESLSKDVERNGRSAELATEKTAAATILTIEKTAAAAALAAAECCCEIQRAIASDGEKTRALVSQVERDALRARLAVFEARV